MDDLGKWEFIYGGSHVGCSGTVALRICTRELLGMVRIFDSMIE